MITTIKNWVRKRRKSFYTKVVIKSALRCGSKPKVNFKTIVNFKTVLGDNFNSNGLTVIGNGTVSIGNNFHCGHGCILITENHNHNGNAIPYDDTYIAKPINISDNVWLGMNVTILPGVNIGEGVIIQAGSVVVNDIESYAIAGGHPAIVFAERDLELYSRLKAEDKFH